MTQNNGLFFDSPPRGIPLIGLMLSVVLCQNYILQSYIVPMCHLGAGSPEQCALKRLLYHTVHTHMCF